MSSLFTSLTSLLFWSSSQESTTPAKPVVSKGKHYKLTNEIVLNNLTLIYNFNKNQRFITNNETGELTLDNRVFPVVTKAKRYCEQAFKTDAVFATYLKALEILQTENKNSDYYTHLKANYEESLKDGGGLDRLIDAYRSIILSETIADQLRNIKQEVKSEHIRVHRD